MQTHILQTTPSEPSDNEIKDKQLVLGYQWESL